MPILLDTGIAKDIVKKIIAYYRDNYGKLSMSQSQYQVREKTMLYRFLTSEKNIGNTNSSVESIFSLTSLVLLISSLSDIDNIYTYNTMLSRVVQDKNGVPLSTPDSATQVLERVSAQEDRPWLTIVWDDPVNLMTYVTYVFQTVFGYSKAKATDLMLKVHHEGKAVVSSGSRERVEIDVKKLHTFGLWATMEQSGK